MEASTHVACKNSTMCGTSVSVPENSDGTSPESRHWDSLDPFISANTRDVIRTVSKCYVRQFVVLLGTPANVICCVVFLKQGLSDKINLLLFWLAVADLINLLYHAVLMSGCYLVDDIHILNWDMITNAKTGYVGRWTGFVAGALMMWMSVDRCLSVSLPLKAKRLVTYRVMVTVIFLCYAVPLAILLPNFLAWTVSWSVDPSTNRSIAHIDRATWFSVNSTLPKDLSNTFIIITQPVFLTVVTCCCLITVTELRQASRKRQLMTENTKLNEEVVKSRMTKMLLLLCFAYVVFLFIDASSAFLVRVIPEYNVFKTYHNTVIVVYQFIFLASCVNSAVNFLAYVVLSSRFRKTLKELFLCH